MRRSTLLALTAFASAVSAVAQQRSPSDSRGTEICTTRAAITLSAPQLLSDDMHRSLPSDSGWQRGGALGDLNGDGTLDIVYGAHVALGNGSGVFRAPSCAPPAAPLDAGRAIALGDVDNDGDLDALLGRDFGDALWLNDGNGCFVDATAGRLPGPSQRDTTRGVALADIDGDHDLDIVLANRGTDCWDGDCTPGEVRVFVNDGSGVFSDESYRVPTAFDDDPCSVALADVDVDGDLDLFVAANDSLGHNAHHRLLLNDGAGAFSDTSLAWPTHSQPFDIDVVAADFDGDGDLDVLFGARDLLANDGAGGFTNASGWPALLGWHERLGLADFDGDGDLDVYVSGESSTDIDHLRLNLGGLTFVDGATPPGAERPTRLVLASDVDADGDVDVIVTREVGEVLFNDGSAHFVDPPPLLPKRTGVTMTVATGDVDGDGFSDVITAGCEAPGLYRGVGNGEFVDASTQLPAVSFESADVALFDIDGDGDLDALFANGGNVTPEPEALFLNDGTGHFIDASSQWTTAADRSHALALADVDHDGDTDVLVANSHSANRLYFNDGHGVLAEIAGKWPSTSDPSYGATFADFDSDGDPDAVLTGGGGSYYENDGTGAFQLVPNVFPPSLYVSGLTSGDLDGDGRIDVVRIAQSADQGGSTVFAYLNAGAPNFVDISSQLPLATDGSFAVELVDLDHDGDLDLLSTGAVSGLRLWTNDGSAAFADESDRVSRFVTYSRDLAVGDLDLDGDLDVVLAGSQGPTRVLVNTSCHLAWRTPPRIGHTLELELFGPPGASWMILGSYGRTFVPVGAAGILQVQRGQLFTSAHGVFDSNGRALYRWPVPPNPALIGTSWYWQLIHRPPRRLSNLEITTLADF